MADEQKTTMHGGIGAGVAQQVVGPDVKLFYANSLRAGLTPVDFVVTFGRLVEHQVGVVVAEDQCEIRMSPQFFKIVAAQMNSIVATYENQFGAINVPKLNVSPTDILKAFGQTAKGQS